MAGNIKGITIEFDGKTSKLDAALKKVNKSTKDINKNLKLVDRGLKFNPSNTILLSNKQQLLKNKIDQTTQKLQALKSAQKKMDASGVDKSSKEYQELQREIVMTESQLKTFKKQLTGVGNVKLTALANQVQQISNKLKSAGQKIASAGKSITQKVTAPLALAGGASLKLSADFDNAMRKVATIADTTDTPISALKQQIMDLSNETGVSSTQIANNVYDAISAGQSTGKAVQFVGAATKLAKAGFAETGASLDVLTTIMNSYGKSAGSAEAISDILINTQNKGKVTVGELSASMGKVIPTAKSYGVSLKDLSAGYVVMTKNGVNARNATTQLKSMYNELGKSSSGVAKILKQETGQSFDELMASGKSVGDVLQILQKHCDKTGAKFTDLWSNANAKSAASLITQQAGDYKDALNSMSNSSGLTAQAMAKLESVTTKVNKIINRFKNVGIQLGDVLMDTLGPILDKVAEKVEDLTNRFSNMSAEEKERIVKIGMIAAAAGPLITVIGSIVSSIGSVLGPVSKAIGLVSKVSGVISQAGGAGAFLAGILGKIKAAFAVLTGPIGIVAAVIGVLVAAFMTLWNTSASFRAQITAAINGIKTSIMSFVTQAKAQFASLGIDFTTITNTLKSVWMGFCNILAPVIVGAFNIVKTVVQTVLNVVLGIIKTFTSIAKGDWSGAFNGLKSIASSILNGIKGIFSSVLNAIVGIGKAAFNMLPGPVQSALNKVKSVVTTVVNKIKSLFGKLKSIVSTVKGIFTKAANAIINPIKKGFNKIKGYVKKIKDAFNKLKLKIPKPKIPKVTITKKTKKVGPVTIPYPSFSLSWNAKGGIFKRPTILGGGQGVGEAGAEAALPLKLLWDEMDARFNRLADQIINGMAVIAKAQSVGGQQTITIPIYLYPSGPKMGEQIVKTYDTYKRRIGGK